MSWTQRFTLVCDADDRDASEDFEGYSITDARRTAFSYGWRHVGGARQGERNDMCPNHSVCPTCGRKR